jgi:hypothetical protein
VIALVVVEIDEDFDLGFEIQLSDAISRGIRVNLLAKN